ncbi:hypothetical protein IE81DRAFT_331291 [Ceraceosorus guamensis]|uniref:Peptidase S33 tripeptidyl aminopeptidase-like C-terminal domain-containing protein n=1 Tax=Ceraceosorus guamensis TaxID=1522189 RepID=A0A316VWW0_9BASI|nr:hypothetical protein IE81DRAFT_331291 [Ceraceosorus guamensis]PWN40933.1 hypothetical protein IE81DRAFT_331291 [Ceraceosorus guamensis]
MAVSIASVTGVAADRGASSIPPADPSSTIAAWMAANPSTSPLTFAYDSAVCSRVFKEVFGKFPLEVNASSYVHKQVDCAAVQVPYDYTQLSDKRRANIGLLRYRPLGIVEGKIKPSGRLFTNPGGPGASGPVSVLDGHEKMEELTGGQYEIFGWDQRGVFSSTPSAPTCFKSGEEQIRFGVQSSIQIPLVPDGESFTSKQVEQRGCLEHSSKESLDFAPYMGSYFNVLDLEYIRRLLAPSSLHSPSKGAINARPQDVENGDLMHFLGFSYSAAGTGQLYLSMFPQFAGKFILEANANLTATLRDPLYKQPATDALLETEKVMLRWLDDCASKANKSQCLLLEYGKTPSEILARVDQAWAKLYDHPRFVKPGNKTYPAGDSALNGLITIAAYRDMIFRAMNMYSYDWWDNRDDYMTWTWKTMLDDDWDLAYAIAFNDTYSITGGGGAGNHTDGTAWNSITQLVYCLDAANDDNVTVDDLVQEISHRAIRTSRHFAPAPKSEFFTSCSRLGWSHPAGRWEGAILASQPRTTPLFVSNKYDSITPRANAEEAVRKLGRANAYLVVDPGYGHETWGRKNTTCTFEARKTYWKDGKLAKDTLFC